MVDDISIGRIDEVVVHEDARVFAVGKADGAFCVEDVFSFCPAETPFKFGEAVVVIRVDDGEFALGEWDFAEWVAEAEATI